MRTLDLDYASSGYLPLADGRPRWVWGLDAIVALARSLGARIVWADLPGARPACSHRPTRTIYLAPWLGYGSPVVLKLVLCHELGHVAGGWDEGRAMAWAARFGDVLTPIDG